MHAARSLIHDLKIVLSEHFAYSHPAFLRQFGFFVIPLGARL